MHADHLCMSSIGLQKAEGQGALPNCKGAEALRGPFDAPRVRHRHGGGDHLFRLPVRHGQLAIGVTITLRQDSAAVMSPVRPRQTCEKKRQIWNMPLASSSKPTDTETTGSSAYLASKLILFAFTPFETVFLDVQIAMTAQVEHRRRTFGRNYGGHAESGAAYYNTSKMVIL